MKIELGTVITLITIIVSAALWLNREHLPTGARYEIQAEIVKGDMQARMDKIYWYEKEKLTRPLTQNEQGNLDYHRKEVIRARDKIDRLEDK